MKLSQDNVEFPSPLCNVYKIKNICHEMQKFVASSCPHFDGEPPLGFYQVNGATCKFIVNSNRGNKGYFIIGLDRMWVNDSQFNWMIKEEKDRREYRKTHRMGQGT